MNNKGMMKFEFLTVIVLLMIIFSGGAVLLLNGANKQKVTTMSQNGLKFAENVVTNIASFKNVNVVYLDEAVSEKVINNIKSPFGGGNCDATESKVNFKNGDTYTTLKCGSRLIDSFKIEDTSKVEMYKISDWTDKKTEGEDIEEKTFYRCEKDGKKLFDNYYEDGYLVAKYNMEYDTSFYYIEELKNECDDLETKVMYRTKSLIK